MRRTLREYIIIGLKGLAMGAADVVPGVSGGTIAFISGIYNELIESINAFNIKNLKMLFSDGFKVFFKAVNGPFLLSLFIGIGISVVTLASVFKNLLETNPILVWSFFFGLVLASILYISKQITSWNAITWILLIIGTLLAYYITTLPVLNAANTSKLFLMLAGALAICAMILPGISGAFILLLLGAFKPAIDAIHNRDMQQIALLGTGAIIGLLTFSRVLKWLFDSYKNATLAVLTGFVIGSLNKIWPWKKVINSQMIDGKLRVIHEKNISPLLIENNQLMLAIILALLGFFIILLLEKWGDLKNNTTI